ncbi:unnamed protein product [Mytilus edulis]|uniref:Uncharacterized protein n=1 Tax=Mytilus edulis TaxID=6550 RepID=A0A8S3PZI7_MYTED|nr:unnamed protein product [Mytilus edulis]
MQAAMGSVVRLRTRSLYECIMQKASWDSPVLIKEMAFDEVVFWKENVEFLNGKELLDEKVCTSVVYTDASGTGFGGYIVEYEESEVIGSWKPDEQVKRIQLGQTIEDEILAAGVTSDNFSTLADRMTINKWMRDNHIKRACDAGFNFEGVPFYLTGNCNSPDTSCIAFNTFGTPKALSICKKTKLKNLFSNWDSFANTTITCIMKFVSDKDCKGNNRDL